MERLSKLHRAYREQIDAGKEPPLDLIVELKHWIRLTHPEPRDWSVFGAIARLGEIDLDFSRTALFISGAPRSGTSALGMMFNLHESIAILMERYHPAYGYHSWMFNEDSIAPKNNQARLHSAQWEMIRTKLKGSRIVGDKRPDFILSFSVTRANFTPEQIRVVHIVRNPLEVASSYETRAHNAKIGIDKDWPPQHDFKKACVDINLNNRNISRILRDSAFRSSVLVVPYDKVMADVEQALAMFRWLEVEVTDKLTGSLKSFIAKGAPSQPNRKNLTRSQIRYLEDNLDHRSAGEVMAAAEQFPSAMSLL